MHCIINNDVMRKINSVYKIYIYQGYYFSCGKCYHSFFFFHLEHSSTNTKISHCTYSVMIKGAASNHKLHCCYYPHHCSCPWSIRAVYIIIGLETMFLLETQSSLPQLPYLLQLTPWEIYEHQCQKTKTSQEKVFQHCHINLSSSITMKEKDGLVWKVRTLYVLLLQNHGYIKHNCLPIF